MQIDIIERDGKTVIAEHLDPDGGGQELTGELLRLALIEEIQLTAEALVADSPEPVVLDGVLASLYWSAPKPHECGEETLAAIMVNASLLLFSVRQGFSIRHALMLLPSPTPGSRTAANSARSCAIATRR